MKKYINAAFAYALFGLLMGVFYREFTKYMNVTWDTSLSKVHAHSISLGMMFFMIVALLVKVTNVEEQKMFKRFFGMYNIGLGVTLVMMVVRGLYEALLWEGAAIDAAIAGIAGLGHILVGGALVHLFLALRKAE